MKTKIFALIISILCLSLIFVACDEGCETHVDADNNGVCDKCEETVETSTETETVAETEEATEEQTIAPCDTHKDADADKICDDCERAIVVIVEQVPAETETAVSMIVNPIPEEGTVEYVDSKLPTEEYISSFVVLDGFHHASAHEEGIIFVIVEDDVGTKTYRVYDASGDELVKIWEGTEAVTETVKTEIEISEYSEWFTVKTTTRVHDGYAFNTSSYKITNYTYAGVQIGETYTWTVESVELGTQLTYEAPVLNGYGHNGEAQVVYNKTLYVVDDENAVIHTANPDTFVDRPTFTSVTDTHGYVVGIRGVHVYDLSKWIECVYVYTTPATHMYASLNVLQNGNILVASIVQLANSSVSYDFIQSGNKYDLQYVIIDPVAKTETTVEFGYMIGSVNPVETQFAFTAAAEKLNVAIVNPVVDGYLDQDNKLVLLVDNELNVLAKLNSFIDVNLVADDIYLKEVALGNGETILELVNSKGEHIDYLTDDASTYAGYFQVGSKLYGYAGKLLIDFNDYASATQYGSYYHLTKAVYDELDEIAGYDHYIYIPGQEPRKIEINSTWINWRIACYDFGYSIYFEKEIAPEEYESSVVFYNVAGTKVENMPNVEIDYVDQVADKLFVHMIDGTVYLAK